MADIAMVFHWTPETMEAMSLASLMGWHKQALERWELLHGRP